jgi:hypothetical protein
MPAPRITGTQNSPGNPVDTTTPATGHPRPPPAAGPTTHPQNTTPALPGPARHAGPVHKP